MIRIRQGHYGCPELAEHQLQAFRVGGRLGGLTGAAVHGMWVPNPLDVIDVHVHPHARGLRTRTDPRKRLADHPDRLTRTAWIDRGTPVERGLADPVSCLELVARTSSAATCFAVAESALRSSVVSSAEWRRILASLPAPARRALAPAGRVSESGGESLLRFELIERRIRFVQQAGIRGVGRVDFLLGARLIVEVDGAQFHTERDDFEEDRRRDAAASVRGYRTLRFSHRQLERRDPLVLAAITAALARGDHE